MSGDLETLLDMYAGAKTQRDKAEAEAMIRELVGPEKAMREKTGISYNRRTVIRTSKSEYAWTLIDELGVKVNTVYNMILEARRTAPGRPLDDVLRELYGAGPAASQPGRKRKSSSDRRKQRVDTMWQRVHHDVLSIAELQFRELDPVEHARFSQDLESELKVLIRSYKARAAHVSRNGVRAEDKSVRRRFIKALDALGIPRPERGQAVDDEYKTHIRRMWRKIAANAHPDRHLGDDAEAGAKRQERFQEINDQYQVIEQYLESHGAVS